MISFCFPGEREREREGGREREGRRDGERQRESYKLILEERLKILSLEYLVIF